MKEHVDASTTGNGAGAQFGDETRVSSFVEFLRTHRDEDHVVALQDFPDPDAIAAAWAYRVLASEFGITVDILYEGRISHQENLALVHVLEIDLTRYSEGSSLDRYDGAVYIDNQGTTTRLADRLAKAQVPAIAVIDHHAQQGMLSPSFSDIRPVGAAATIFADYLRSGAIVQLDAENAEHVRLATALMHALRSETNGFILAGREEFAAAEYLTQLQDIDLVEKILRVQRSRGTMDVFRIALTDRVVLEGYSIAGVGYLRAADRDAIPQAADLLLTEENVSVAIVYGMLMGEGDREVVVGSVRTSRLTLDVDNFLKAALGSDAQGRYYGGGRTHAGGFEIPVGFLEGGGAADQLKLKWEAFDQQIRGRLLNAAGLAAEEDSEE